MTVRAEDVPGAGRVRMTLSMWNKKSTYFGIMERENPEARPQGQACTLIMSSLS